MDYDKDQINKALSAGLIYDNFNVTADLISSVAKLHFYDIDELKSKRKAKSIWALACRTAALNLLKYKSDVAIDKDFKESFVYIMTDLHNPNLYKIGRSVDPYSRLSTANTFSPTRSFKLVSFRFSEDAVELEKYLHSIYHRDHEAGEWFYFPFIQPVIDKLTSKSARYTPVELL
ncbi:hypothetical protein CPT_Muldoon_133 [Serratia phage Muldoon]|uniref:Bacteriophage T5 Orf172 DNA-binding domain-containing protein n=1 Tax=Serratia phage Muldoon TaxID=2601678 RepID=A0A5P8PHA5_9CAUD|nr:hypothetical protein HYP94_gp254 [Serratia phage Muldoon]QFR56087.1 hypothetical protein CPT_Muldoon_133 [Serratia phage Muldoon]UNA02496.1 hypothetical protein [Serratia phage SP1]